MIHHPFSRLYVVAALAGAFVSYSMAQEAARISGQVTDQSGAPVPNVSLTLTENNTQVSRVGHTGVDGIYEFADVAPGNYTLQANATGFRKQVISNVNLEVAQVRRLDLKLQLGAINESVDVTASSVALQTEDSQVGGVVENKAVNDLPLNGRDFTQLMILMPGAVEGSSGNVTAGHYAERVAGTAFSVNGQHSNYNEFLIDGFMAKEVQDGTNAVSPIIDSLREFRVQSSNYSAQFGTEAGGQINTVLKSGTNELHGSAWEYLRNDDFDANNFFNNLSGVSKAEYRRNQFGIAAGGPVLLPKYDGRNRTFIYGAFEDTRIIKGSTQLTTVPTAAERQGIFPGPVMDPLTGMPFPNNTIPTARFNSITTQILAKYVPLPNNGAGTFNYISNYPFTTGALYSNWRIDHRFSAKDSIFGHYLFNDTAYTYPKLFPTDGVADDIRGQNVLGAWTHIFGPNTINEFRIGYSRFFENEFQSFEGKENVVQELGIQGLCENPQCWGIPQQSVTGFAGFGEHGGQAASGPRGWFNHVYQIQDSYSHQAGSHSLSTGLVVGRNFDNFREAIDPRGAYSYNGVFTGQPFGDYLLGLPFSTTLNTTIFDPHFRYNNAAPFFQDDWRVSSALTINLGLRYEWNGRPESKSKTVSGVLFSQGAAQLVTAQNPGGLPSSLVYNDYHDIAPRIGFAYNPQALGGRTVFRAAYGVFYQRESANTWADTAIDAPFVQNATINLNNTPGSPLYFANFNMTNPYAIATPATSTVYAIDPHFLDARVQQWTFNIQQSLTPSTILQIAYVGNHDSHMPRETDPNQPLPGPGPVAARRPYPSFGAIYYLDSNGNSSYNGLQVELEKRYSNGLQFISSYTYSKCIDDTPGTIVGEGGVRFQNNYNFHGARGLCAQDARQRYSFSGVYDLPFGKNRHYLSNASFVEDLILGGWQINGILTLRTGQPFTVVMASDVSNTADLSTWANVVGSPNSVSNRSINEWFNIAAFASPAQYTFGNEGRNVVEGPGVNNLDVSFFKNFPVAEQRSFQFRAEFFNSLNHAQFALPGATLGTAQFGKISSLSHDPREIQLSLKFLF